MIERELACLGPHGFHRLAYLDWPGPAREAPVLLCVHGLTRNGRDFDTIARALSKHYRVVCPDMPGRGKSEWLSDPADYTTPVYLADLAALIARLDVARVDWLGTSMGGNLGMLFASMPGAPIRKLVMNDIGAVIPKAGLERIALYVGLDPSFADLAAFETALRIVHAPFGPLSDAQWRQLAAHSARRKPDGSIGSNYDPTIAQSFKQGPVVDIDLWQSWDKIACPVLVLRGAESDILAKRDAEAMTQRGPRATLLEFAGIGHAPALVAEDQIAAIRDFLLG
ncbi:MAG TPA: alpha/beta hydrolase [Stellaceae bacterium]|jgi:pimeloyl-ACP methyl ester carboxylesterase|nr:alpha/beta hydrolase [Stellaceae bacterium]